jgi:DNA-binding NarL/FixJ family response regulator
MPCTASLKAEGTNLTPTGVGAAPVPSLNAAIHWLLERLYWGILLPESPVTGKHVSLSERNRQICTRYAGGATLEEIARDLGLSHQRVHQIIHRWC